jgi:hypothetical protein
MSTHEIEKLPGEPILVSTVFGAWSSGDELELGDSLDQVIEYLDAADEPLYYVADVSGLKLDLPDMILTANQTARGSKAILHHPNLREFLVVTEAKLIELASRGLGSEVFGNVPVAVFQTLEEALAYARAGSKRPT